MSVKIPEAPNIIGGEAVTRSPDIIRPVSEIPHFSVDFSGLQESIGDVGRAYQKMVEDQNTTYMNAVKVEYNKHMGEYQQQIFDKHQGKDAMYLYDRYIKPESNKWVSNLFGEPKDDGQIRISDKKLQQQFSDWVLTQQPTYINNSAVYGQREYEKWRQSVWEQQNNTAANMILNAESNITIQNGINLIRTTEYDMNPGMDQRNIEMSAAAKVETAISAYVNKRAVKDPYGALLVLDNDEVIASNLSEATKEKLKPGIRSSYKAMAESEYADWVYSDGAKGSIGMLTPSTIEQVFGVTSEREVNGIIAEIKAKGKEKADAIKKQEAGVVAADTLRATNMLLEARTQDEKTQAMRNLFAINPTAANSLADAEVRSLAVQQAVDVLGPDMESIMKDFNDAVGTTTGEATPEFLEAALKDTLGSSGEVLYQTIEFAKKYVPGGQWFDIKQEAKPVTSSDASVAIKDMVSQGRLTEEQAGAVFRVWEEASNRQAHMGAYKDISTRIASGEIQAYDPALMGDLPSAMQTQLLMQMKVQGEYYNTVRDLEKADIKLDSVIKDTGADAQYANLDIDSQNMLKRGIVLEVNKYKALHSGQLPSKEELEGMIYRVQKNSISPEMMVIQNIADVENYSADSLTDAQRYNLATYKSASAEYNKPQKRGLADQVKRAESAIDSLSHSSELSASERMFVLTNKEYFVRLLQAGDITTIANFLGLAKQGGF